MSVISCRKSFKKGKPENLLGVREKSIPSEARKVKFSPKNQQIEKISTVEKPVANLKNFFQKSLGATRVNLWHMHIFGKNISENKLVQ